MPLTVADDVARPQYVNVSRVTVAVGGVQRHQVVRRVQPPFDAIPHGHERHPRQIQGPGEFGGATHGSRRTVQRQEHCFRRCRQLVTLGRIHDPLGRGRPVELFQVDPSLGLRRPGARLRLDPVGRRVAKLQLQPQPSLLLRHGSDRHSQHLDGGRQLVGRQIDGQHVFAAVNNHLFAPQQRPPIMRAGLRQHQIAARFAAQPGRPIAQHQVSRLAGDFHRGEAQRPDHLPALAFDGHSQPIALNARGKRLRQTLRRPGALGMPACRRAAVERLGSRQRIGGETGGQAQHSTGNQRTTSSPHFGALKRCVRAIQRRAQSLRSQATAMSTHYSPRID